MRILFVAMSDSPHAAGWLNLLKDTGWEVYLFPVYATPRSQPYWQIKSTTCLLPGSGGDGVRLASLLPHAGASFQAEVLLMQRPKKGIFRRISWLSWVIKRIKPDIVHSLEFQHAGVLTLNARYQIGADFPTWAISNYGSDVYLFGRLAATRPDVLRLLGLVNQYMAECQRDVDLARELGYQGGVMPVVPHCGGFDLARFRSLAQPGPTSARRVIAIKGYQNWAGRALTVLKAVELCARELAGYKIRLFLANEEVRIAAELLAQDTGLDIECIYGGQPYDDILRLLGSARVYLGASISDAASTSMLESMAMGAFPIQSCTACADEWIEHGKSGFIVPPDDPRIIADCLRRAVSDDALVDQAAKLNAATADRRLDRAKVSSLVVESYEKMVAS